MHSADAIISHCLLLCEFWLFHPILQYDTHSRNRHHKLFPFFWRRFLVCLSCISGTAFVWYQISAQKSRKTLSTLLYSKPESGMHVTEMMTYDWLMITAYVLICFLVVILLKLRVHHLCHSQYQKLSSRCIWHKKPASENGVDFWHRFLECVSWALIC